MIFCDVTLECIPTPDKLNESDRSVSRGWASIPKVVGSISAVVRYIFQLGRFGHNATNVILKVFMQNDCSSKLYITTIFSKLGSNIIKMIHSRFYT